MLRDFPAFDPDKFFEEMFSTIRSRKLFSKGRGEVFQMLFQVLGGEVVLADSSEDAVDMLATGAGMTQHAVIPWKKVESTQQNQDESVFLDHGGIGGQFTGESCHGVPGLSVG